MMVQFSSSETVSLEKQIDNSVQTVHTKPEDVESVYEIHRCVDWIKKGNFKKVCLQFPDYLLSDSSEVAQRLQSHLNQTVYVMGDTAYESCCVDYVAAAHIEADAVIHCGPVCFSRASDNIPCLKIYEKKPLNVGHIKEEFLKEATIRKEDNVVMLIDTPYLVHMAAIQETFQDYPSLQVVPIDGDNLNINSAVTIFIGGNRRKIINLMLSFRPRELYYYDPELALSKFVNYQQDSKIIKRRYFLVEKIKDSNTIGIVIGTLAVRNYLKIIERTKRLIKASGKKYYVISVGKPTIAKLANFPELDIYVIITCAMNEIYESRDFYKPIVTPFDVELALNPRARDVQFSYDYNSYLADGDLDETDFENIKRDDETDVSLITGKVRSNKVNEEDVTNVDGAEESRIAVRNAGTVALGSFGAGFLSERSWKGLEQKLGEDEPKMAGEGRKGIAQGYENEKL